jgi:hypothetical protein
MDTPICANDAAETASIMNANNNERNERMVGMIRIVLPLAGSS